ncbi:MAG: hypothetical protein K0S61_275 [Anaerocolumna sp.]|jgi:hypothetical protein|nr:hypothetical protein [Anaerocolumna sp.]
MKKLTNLLRNDQILRGNLKFAGFLSVLCINVIVFGEAIGRWFKGMDVNSISQAIQVILGLDAIYAILILFMYVISEKLFRAVNAAITAFILVICTNVYFAFNGVEASGLEWITSTVSNTIVVFYGILGLGIMIRGIWESMQDRVGGEYSNFKLTYKIVLGNKNLLVFAFTLFIYTVAGWVEAKGILDIQGLTIATIIAIGALLITTCIRILLNIAFASKSRAFGKR